MTHSSFALAVVAVGLLAFGATTPLTGSQPAVAAEGSQSQPVVDAHKKCKRGYVYSHARKKCVRIRRGSY